MSSKKEKKIGCTICTNTIIPTGSQLVGPEADLKCTSLPHLSVQSFDKKYGQNNRFVFISPFLGNPGSATKVCVAY